MYSLGMAPPVTSFTNSKPSPAFGSRLSWILAYWPEPPDCFLCVYQNEVPAVIVSRYATWGAPTRASTLNSRLMRSTMISRCSSPMPSITVWFVSSSRLKRKDGSSAASFVSASIILSESAWDAGSQATLITGSGKSILSRTIGASRAQRVSPVVVSLRPTRAMMSPALASLISSRLLECISTMRPRRSFCLVRGFSIMSPDFTLPE
mmetsp:Transcript_68954/g.202414  ORF Transcript_68954/g.202414 Transcript_68954/m.202414 type:complete len:207 (-) Transcript_68954:1358-1978(-)